MGGFVFSADWHLSFGTWAKHPTLVGDSYHSLRQIVDYCIEHDCPLIAGGDLNLFRTLSLLVSCVAKWTGCKRKACRFTLFRGNTSG